MKLPVVNGKGSIARLKTALIVVVFGTWDAAALGEVVVTAGTATALVEWPSQPAVPSKTMSGRHRVSAPPGLANSDERRLALDSIRVADE